MTSIVEGNLTFSFPTNCEVAKYDDWSFYRNRFGSVAGVSKAVDIVCLEGHTAWLVEVKDYRQHPRTKAVDLADEVAQKVRDSLAGLAAAGKVTNYDGDERRLARRALQKRRWRVVLHLEQPARPHKLRPTAIDPANILKKLRSRRLKAIDPHPVVAGMSNMPSALPWTVG